MFDRGKNMAQKIILTGDRPTGKLHVGHYIGSLKKRVSMQNSGKYDFMKDLTKGSPSKAES